MPRRGFSGPASEGVQDHGFARVGTMQVQAIMPPSMDLRMAKMFGPKLRQLRGYALLSKCTTHITAGLATLTYMRPALGFLSH